MKIKRYDSSMQPLWDDFVRTSKNGTFLHLRPYMDYHSDRFHDHSLMFYGDSDRLMAVLPANVVDDQLWSHQGLTYGGLLLSPHARATEVGRMFKSLVGFMSDNGLRKLHLKDVPHIYHRQPSDESEYWLWRYGATMETCLISTTVPLHPKQSIVIERRRNRGVKKAHEAGLSIEYNAPIDVLWPVVQNNLRERYDVSPVHTLDEIKLLQSRFPKQILCHVVRNSEGAVVAGVVLYECNECVVHAQYGHATPEGKQQGALDLLYMSIIEDYRSRGTFDFFDYGNSNERAGYYLNDNLILQKEGFGGRGVTYKTYSLTVR